MKRWLVTLTIPSHDLGKWHYDVWARDEKSAKNKALKNWAESCCLDEVESVSALPITADTMSRRIGECSNKIELHMILNAFGNTIR